MGFNPILALEKFLDTNIESGSIWYYVVGLAAIALYMVVKNIWFK
jgi:hypothetical protein